MFETWKWELIRKHFDGEKKESSAIAEDNTIALAEQTDFDHVSWSGNVEEGKIQFLSESGWESDRVQLKDCGLNVCSIILVCLGDFFYKEPLWGKRGGGGAMWKGVWDWLVARAKLRALKWWGHSSVGNQVVHIHSKHLGLNCVFGLLGKCY